MKEQKIMVQDVIRDVLTILERQGYKIHNTRRYNTIYRALAQYCQNQFNGEYSSEIGAAFIQSLRQREPPLSKPFIDVYITCVERANHVIEGETDWYPRKKILEYTDSVFRNEARLYDEYLRNSGKTKSDVRARMHVVARFLQYVDQSGIKKLSQLTAKTIYGAFEAASDKGGFHKSISAFFRYAHRHDLTEQDFSILVPSASRHIPVPTVYTPDEVEKIIATAAQSKECGKRNKAIVLIAARLGLRSCDIANLQFENIHRDTGMIEIQQAKTGEPHSVPLLPEILEALDDYVENERPKRSDNHVFLCNSLPHTGAVQPHTIYTIVSRIIETTDIDTNCRKRGAHALRSSLATALLNEGYNHREVQNALGHKSPEAVKSYVKTEVEHLRNYALPVPAPIGIFASKLGLGVTT